MNPHDRFYKVRESDRLTWRAWVLAIGTALVLAYLSALFI